MTTLAPPPGTWPVSNAAKRTPPPGALCQEASTLSRNIYIPCGRPAVFVVKNFDPAPYAMCAACADHNVRNRGARYQMAHETDTLAVIGGGGTVPQFPVTNTPQQPAPFAPQASAAIPAPILARLAAARLPQDNDGLLMLWQASKKAISDAQADEMMLRKLAVVVIVPDAEEGTNTVELGEGYKLKAVVKYNYKLKAPVGSKKDTIDAIDDVIDNFAKISNEGAFIAERLFKWTVDMSLTEYRKLVEESETSQVKSMLLKELETVLEVGEAAPTLNIVEPKVKK